MEMGFFMHRARPRAQVCSGKKNKVKIVFCSGMNKFCPPAAASREPRRGNKYERTRLCADGGWGWEVIDKIGRGAHHSRRPLLKLLSRFGALFLKAREAPSKKKEADSKTANLILGETKG